MAEEKVKQYCKPILKVYPGPKPHTEGMNFVQADSGYRREPGSESVHDHVSVTHPKDLLKYLEDDFSKP